MVCGWHDGDILVRTTYSPVEIRRLSSTTGTATPHLTLTPPALGLKGVDAVALAGSRHADSYGQERSELFLLDTLESVD